MFGGILTYATEGTSLLRLYWSFSSVKSLSRARLVATPWTAARQASLSITNFQSPPKPKSMELVMPSSHLILCRPLLLMPPMPPSLRVFSNESTLRIRWPKYCSFSFSTSHSNEHPGLTSFRMDWLDLLVVQGTCKSLLQHYSSKASIFQCSAFFTVQLSHPYMTTGKTIALTRWAFVGKVLCLLFNMLSRLVITFLPRSKCVLISWLQSPSAVILEPPEIKSAAGFHCFPIDFPWRDRTRLGWLKYLSSSRQSLSRVWLFANPWTVAYQAPPSMGFCRQEYWSELQFPSPGDLPDPGIKPGSPAL